ncbi:MAG TPA: NDP-sugar synthase [Actinomycetota bacterium]|nr:NDP-sugar synthase [Actinomycetota bacterium]
MKALLLAGGFGTRLRPLTYTRPKHLLPVANREHIVHVFDLLQRHGIDDVVLLTSYLAETFDYLVASGRERGLNLEVSQEVEPLGTAGALKNAEAFTGGETFLAFNGDVLMDVDLGAVVDFHRRREAEATIVLTPVEDPSIYGVVPTDADGRVQDFIEKPPPGEAPTNLINAGVYVIEPSVLDRIPPGQVWSIERATFPSLVEEGARLFATAATGYWMDIGTPQKYLQANLDALAGRFPTAGLALEGDAVASDGARAAEGARVSSSCLGSGVTIGAGARVTESVLLPGVAVGDGAVVHRSVLGEGVTVPAGASLDGAAVGDHETVGEPSTAQQR